MCSGGTEEDSGKESLTPGWNDSSRSRHSQFAFAGGGAGRPIAALCGASSFDGGEWPLRWKFSAHSHFMNLQQTVSSFMAFLFIPYIIRLCWFSKLPFMEPEHNKIFLAAQIPPLRSVLFALETAKTKVSPKLVPAEGGMPALPLGPAASSQALGCVGRTWGCSVFIGFAGGSVGWVGLVFSASSTILLFHRLGSGTK